MKIAAYYVEEIIGRINCPSDTYCPLKGVRFTQHALTLKQPHLPRPMDTFSFEIFFMVKKYAPELHADEYLDLIEDAVFEEFAGDVTPGMLGGYPMLYCTIEAASPGGAYDKVVARILPHIIKAGLDPESILLMPIPDEHRELEPGLGLVG